MSSINSIEPLFRGGVCYRDGRLTSHDLLMEVELLLNFLSGKLTSQWKMDLLEDVFPIENGDLFQPAMLVVFFGQRSFLEVKFVFIKQGPGRVDLPKWARNNRSQVQGHSDDNVVQNLENKLFL